jgi:outer membrane protein TolC
MQGAKADYLPEFSAGGNAQRAIGSGASSDIVTGISGSASWEVDLSGRISSTVDAARSDFASAGYNLDDLRRFVIGQVASATISARATAVQLAIAKDSLCIADDNLQIAKWRQMAGLVSALDVEQARSQRAQVAASIPLLDSSLAATANAISTLIGEPPGRVFQMLSDSDAVPAPPDQELFAAPAQVLVRRPDVRAAEYRLLADLSRIRSAKSRKMPQLQLNGSLATSTLGGIGLFDIVGGNVVAGINQLLFDGGRTRARINSAKAIADSSLAAWRKSILVALEEVETSMAERQANERRVASQLARTQYRSGLIDFAPLLTTENALLNTRNALIAAEADRARAFVRLTQALGGGWTTPTGSETADGTAK